MLKTWSADTQKADGPKPISGGNSAENFVIEPTKDDEAHQQASGGAPVVSPFATRLEALDDDERANAVIQLETRADLTPSDADTVKKAEDLWNEGKFDQAIEMIGSLGEAQAIVSLAISWKLPRAVLSPNWVPTDTAIGTRANIQGTCLDFDAQNGNLFAVLKQKDETTGFWHWLVNISKDNGRSWAETFDWASNYTVLDVDAAVAGNFLWVGYLNSGVQKKAFMRRFSVNDGSYDSAFGLPAVIDKNKTVKEISVFSNADDYDNRVYYTAILENPLSPSIAEAIQYTPPANAGPEGEPAPVPIGEDPSETLRQLAQHPKLKAAHLILNNFNKGKATTRVIVNLKDPGQMSSGPVRQNFKDKNVREKVRQDVEAALNRVLNTMNPNAVKITNRFTYVFGFSAEVTLEGLVSLVNHPDVDSLNEDGIREPHLAQGIPLINASTARSNYGGAGIAIAICDTGVDYTHARLGNGAFPNTKVIGGYDTGENDADPMDEQGHGTSCAGIAAGALGTSGDYIGGVAYDAKIYAVKMSRADIGHRAYDSDMVQAWEWCVTHQDDDPNNPIMIISTSFGGGYYTSEAACDAYNASMTTAAANAKAAGITLFVSTGNDGFCDGTGWPGGISHVVGVGAVYDADIGRNPDLGYVGCISLDSCVGFTAGCPCDSGNCYVDETTAADQVTTYSSSASFMELFGPSNDTYTTALGGGYRTDFGGTSAACPYAAGSAAVLQCAAKANKGAFLSPDQVQSALTTTGNPVTDPKAGITKPRINLGNAVATVMADNLVFFWAKDIDTASPIWIEQKTGVNNAWKGLDGAWNQGYKTGENDFAYYLSYIASGSGANPVMVLCMGDFSRQAVTIYSNYSGAHGTTAVSAYDDTVICAYEYRPSTFGIRYNISYDGGGSWSNSYWTSSENSYFYPDVTARGGKGTAIVFQEEAGEPDRVWFVYRNHYSSGPWDVFLQINQNDCWTGLPYTIQWLPTLPGQAASYGTVYIGGDWKAYFNRSDGRALLPIGAINLLLLDE